MNCHVFELTAVSLVVFNYIDLWIILSIFNQTPQDRLYLKIPMKKLNARLINKNRKQENNRAGKLPE